MGCGSSRFCITRGGDTSHLYTRLSLLNRPSDRALTDSCHSSSTPVLKGKDHQKREKVGKEEACIDEESSTEEDSNDRDNDINSFQSPSFSVYCVPSEFDDENSEGDHNPEEFKEDQKMDVQIYKKGSRSGFGKSEAPRKERKSFRSRLFRYVYCSPQDSIVKLKGSLGKFSW